MNQEDAVRLVVLEHRNVLITGSAGTGKSFVLRQIISSLKRENCAVTATTGIAAVLIGGSTIHRTFGLTPSSVKKGNTTPTEKVKKVWKRLKVLIIDEVSMLNADLFMFLDKQARRCRQRLDEPFGGLQVVLVGDFYQLPPVWKETDKKQFVFETELWKQLEITVVELGGRNYRQADPLFVELLERVRTGKTTDEDIARLTESKQVVGDGSIGATRLYCKNVNVDMENANHLSKLPIETEHKYKTFADSPKAFQILSIVPESVDLRIGAQVMLLANLDVEIGLANGSRGVVVGFNNGGWPVVKFIRVKCVITPFTWNVEDDDKELTVIAVPLKLAWALTIHKSQGQSIDHLDIDVSGSFACGQVYTALSRATSLEGMRVLPFNKALIRVHPRVREFYATLASD